MELRGNLKDFSLPDIIQLVGFGRKTGVLRVGCAEGDAALFFDEGSVVHAEHNGTRGVEAVYALFHVAEGEFQFQKEIASPDRTITMDSTNLLMEAARLLDESRREMPSSGDEECRSGEWVQESESPREPGEIKREIRTLVRSRFGRDSRRLEQAVDRCGDSVEELLDLAGRMERYIRVFLDGDSSRLLGQEIRSYITGLSSLS